MAEYERQHYLPQFYLRSFASNETSGLVWAYTAKRQSWRLSSIKKEIGWEPFYYSNHNEDGSWDHTIENVIDSDDRMPTAITRLISKRSEPSQDDRLAIAKFVGLLIARVPAYHKYIEGVVFNHARMMTEELHQQFLADPAALEVMNEVFRKITDQPDHPGFSLTETHPNRFPESFPEEQVIQSGLATAAFRAELIAEMGWSLIIAPPFSTFITSDNPVFLMDGRGQAEIGGGMAKPDILISVPLSKNVLLLADPIGAGQPMIVQPISEELVSEYNQKTAYYATKALVAPTKEFPGHHRAVTRFRSTVEAGSGLKS